jgi:hypothetical protein
MNKTLRNIKQRMGAIQFGLLRMRDNNEQVTTLQVKLAENEGAMLSCLVTDTLPRKNLLNQSVNFIQKCHNDYLYIAGKVTDANKDSKKILSVEITKACWFVKKSKGDVSWLQQKYIYEHTNTPAA